MGGNLVDISPFDRRQNCFISSNFYCPSILSKDLKFVSRYINLLKQETDVSYYVYLLLDPESKLPFYVGKGKGNRAEQHLWRGTQLKYKNALEESGNHDRRMDKIIEIRSRGMEPEIVIVVENIFTEEAAYEFEEELILKYGRKGIEEDGILMNICLGSRPPNHRGRSYEEIYGSKEAAEEQIEKRRVLQLERGGYGPKKHSFETIEKFRLSNSGERNGRFGKPVSSETRAKIGNANRGKIQSEETRAKIADATKGRRHSKESRKKMSEARLSIPKKSCSHCFQFFFPNVIERHERACERKNL